MPAARNRTIGLVAIMSLAASFTARAEEPARVRVEIAPTIFIAGTDGSISVEGIDVAFDKTPGDLFDYVEFAGGLAGLVQYDHWVFRAQFDYFRMSTDALAVEDRPAGGTLDSDLYVTAAAVGYRFDGWKEGQTYDLLIGLRSLHVANALELTGGASYGADRDLLDPALAVRGTYPLFPRKIEGLALTATAAFGGGGDSRFVYDLQPAIQYRITDAVAARLGYRRLGWRVEGDQIDGEWKFALSGLTGGIAVTF